MPNVLFVFADQWRAQATGYSGDPNVKTPCLDSLAEQGVNCVNAVSTCPVCSPYRGSLITGCYPLTHGVFLNDVHLRDDSISVARVFAKAGYQTAYVGKWHLNGRGRAHFIPRESRQGFEYWKVLECTHGYNRSRYFADDDVVQTWDGYDAIAQTRDVQQYLKAHAGGKPFCLFLSWGPPHNPYETAPEKYRAMFKPEDLVLRPNVPPEKAAAARRDLAGYYAHIAALDACTGELRQTLRELGLEENTILVFTSDHGDQLGSHGLQRKQHPYDESIRVPLLVHWPAGLGKTTRPIATPIGTPDLMPTLLGLCGISIPATVEGSDFSAHLRGGPPPGKPAALIACYAVFGEYRRANGGREYRGVRTARYTYVRDLQGPWLLFDNRLDPHQFRNRCNDPACASQQQELETLLREKLAATKDDFQPAQFYIDKWKYVVDKSGTVPYTD